MTADAFAAIRAALAEFYQTEDEVTTWMHSPQRLLGGATAYERVAAGHGDEVWALIDQLRSGAFV